MSDPSKPQDRNLALDEVVAAYLKAVGDGAAPDRQSWLRRYPDLAAELAEFFATREQTERLAVQPSHTLAQDQPPELKQSPGAIPPSSSMDNSGHFGDYELLGEISRGGMGVVYRARQVSLNRIVALKMILAGQLASSDEVQRFQREAEAVANLDHPHIVPVYEVGEHQGRHYFSMKLIEGGSLAQRTARGEWNIASTSLQRSTVKLASTGARRGASGTGNETTKEQQRSIAKLMITVARAVHYAHQRGILHRDLKPGNILMDAHGKAYVTDFGLAKRVEGDLQATMTGNIVGTPSYMPPEQARAEKALTTAVDVYSLGAVFYELLTGRPPFLGKTAMDTVQMVLTQEPTSPSRLQPRLPRDLVTICMKCLRKEPAKRYDSADSFAKDLQRFLDGEPIKAAPVRQWERLVKWARRRPAAAALVAVIAIGSLALLAGGVAFQIHLNLALAEAKAERDAAIQRLVRLNIQTGMDLADSGRLPLGLPWLVEALRLQVMLNQDRSANSAKNVSKAGETIEHEHDVVGPKADSITERIFRIRLALVLRSCPRLLRLWYHQGPANDGEFSPDGRLVVSGGSDRQATIWNVFSGEVTGEPLRHDGNVNTVCFSPDGKRVLTASADGTARIWEVAGTRELCRAPQHRGEVLAAAFSPDGLRFCTAGADGTVRICDAKTGRELVPALQHGGAAVRHAAFSPDGRLLVTVAGQAARLWSTDSGAPAGPHSELRHDGQQVLTAAFDNTGSRLVTGGTDNLARLWDVASGRQLGDTRKHDQSVIFACFSPDGTRVATASDDGLARVWKVAGSESAIHDLRHRSRVNHLSFSPDGRYLATGCYDNTAVVWNIATGRPFSHSLEANGDIRRARFSPDGRYVLTVSSSGAIRMWHPLEAFRMPKPMHGSESLFSKARSADGKLEVSSADGVTLQIQDAKTGKPIGPDFRPGGVVRAALFNQNGSRLLTMNNNGYGQIWEPATGRRNPDRLLTHGSAVVCGAFSLDGRLVATGSSDDTARVWDVATGEPRTPYMRHDGTVSQVVFSPDCHFLLTASEDGNARLWTVDNGERLSPPLDPNGWVKEVFASPDSPAAWKLEGEERSIEDLQLEAEWLSGRYIDKTLGGLVPFSRGELQSLRDRIKSRCPQLFSLPP